MVLALSNTPMIMWPNLSASTAPRMMVAIMRAGLHILSSSSHYYCPVFPVAIEPIVYSSNRYVALKLAAKYQLTSV